MGGKIFKSSREIPINCLNPTLQNFAKVFRWHELFPDKNIHENIVGSLNGDFINDIDIVLETKEFYDSFVSESIFSENFNLNQDEFQSSLMTYDKGFREILAGKKEVKVINEKERKVIVSKGLLKTILEPRLTYFLSKLNFNSSNALNDFYEQELESYNDILNELENNNIEADKKIESKIQRIQNKKEEILFEKENGQEHALIYLINEDFLAMNGVISFAFPVFSTPSSLYQTSDGRNCFIQIDLLLGSEKWQKQYKNHKEKSVNKNALRNVILQSVVSSLSKKSEKRFFFKLLHHFHSNDENILGHTKNLIENADKFDSAYYSIQSQIKSEDDNKKIKEMEKSIRELEHDNFLSRYISVDPNHGVLLTTVVFEYKNGKRLVSKYRKDKLKLVDDFDTFIKCLFGDEESIENYNNLENAFLSFIRLCDSGHFSEKEKIETVDKLKEYITENDIEINDWLKDNLF
jgi:hypothetical protein